MAGIIREIIKQIKTTEVDDGESDNFFEAENDLALPLNRKQQKQKFAEKTHIAKHVADAFGLKDLNVSAPDFENRDCGLSPGTLFHENTTKPIESWDVEQAKTMARSIKERLGSSPFAFYFTTRARDEKELDSKQIAQSFTYYLGGKIETLADVEARNDPEEKILRSNMKYNDIERIIINTNSWKVTQPLRDGDVVLDWEK